MRAPTRWSILPMPMWRRALRSCCASLAEPRRTAREATRSLEAGQVSPLPWGELLSKFQTRDVLPIASVRAGVLPRAYRAFALERPAHRADLLSEAVERV